jgi:hypothetical protein
MAIPKHPIVWHEYLTPQWIGGGAVVALLAWFGWLYPLIPVTLVGWVAAVVSGFFVGAWAVLCVAAILWLQRQTRFIWIARSAGIFVALSLGIGIFAAAYQVQSLLTENFSYFGR